MGRAGLTLTLAWSLLATSAWAAGLIAQEVALPVGSAGPNPALEDLDGNPVHLMDFIQEGKPALIEFWASWCEQCEALQPQMDEVEARFGSQVSVVAVAVAVAQSQRRVKRYVEEHGHGYPYLWDGGGDAVRSYQVPGTSVVVILDASGTVAYTGTGPGQDLVAAVTKVLEGGRALPPIPPAAASPGRWRP